MYDLLLLSKTFTECEFITKLNLSNNTLKTIPGTIFSKLQFLISFDASHNAIKTLPRTLPKASNLKICSFKGNQIKKCPPTLGNAFQIEYLDLSDNVITNLPKNIYNLRNEVNLSGNRIETLPVAKETKKIKLYVSKLNLADNRICELPESIGELAQLESLDLSGNRLEELPHEMMELRYGVGWKIVFYFIFFYSYRFFFKCKILRTFFPTSLHLSFLDISKNKLRLLPENFGVFAGYSLKTLNLSENVLETLPPSFSNMISAESIDLSKNSLKKLPPANTEDPKSRFGRDLKNLDLSKNQLESAEGWFNDKNSFTSLEKLNISTNLLPKLDEKSLGNMINLRELDIRVAKPRGATFRGAE